MITAIFCTIQWRFTYNDKHHSLIVDNDFSVVIALSISAVRDLLHVEAHGVLYLFIGELVRCDLCVQFHTLIYWIPLTPQVSRERAVGTYSWNTNIHNYTCKSCPQIAAGWLNQVLTINDLLFSWELRLRCLQLTFDLGTCEASRFDSNSNPPSDSILCEMDWLIQKFANRIGRACSFAGCKLSQTTQCQCHCCLKRERSQTWWR